MYYIERIEIAKNSLCYEFLDYASSVWDPYHQGDVSKLEMVQHRAARFVGQCHFTLNWPSLKSSNSLLFFL